MSNPHLDAATGNLKASVGNSVVEGTYLVAVAQVEATLALAYEQRTANLLATLNPPTHNISDWTPEMIDDHNKRLKDIATRLGLGDTK